MKRQNLSRRQFLATAAALSAPMIIPASALGRAGRPAPSERITLGCLGFGTIALATTREFLDDKRVQVVAVCDVVKQGTNYGYRGEKEGGLQIGRQMVDDHYARLREKGASQTSDCRTYRDFRQVLAQADIDAVNISTPDHWHAIMAIEAAKAGKHIYGQKPLSLSVEEGRHMCRAVAAARVTWQTGSQQRSDAKFRKACELVRNGYLGKVHTVKVGLPGGHRDFNQMAAQTLPTEVPKGMDWDLWQGPAPKREFCPALHPLNWRHNLDYSGGAITDFGAHHIDIAQWAMDTENTGPVEMLNATAELPPPDALYNTATRFHFECKYAEGWQMVVADESELEAGIRFEGEEGKWLFVTRGKLTANPESLVEEEIPEGKVRVYPSDDHIGNFIDCIQSGKPTVAPIEAAHRTITVAHLGNIMLRLGRQKLRWDPRAEQVVDDEKANKMLSRPMRSPWSLG